MEPMRPVDYVEHQDSVVERRRTRLWRVFFGFLLVGQLIALTVFDVDFWWALAATSTLVGLHEACWFAIGRRRSVV
ncbi:hypothetical protein [Rhodococcus sp. AW25M09]|uniref:hypothetical protein n=1 Tax=Rhodococcus sp. AW25M09 TaxID=1268303 RepID=UPI0003450F58|nr:hypothetical protein [Rhodococcus sp. AW25M09]